MDATTLQTLVRGFEDLSLPKEQWTHAAHIATAFHYVSTLDDARALTTMRSNIQAFNASKGGPPSAYHETITRAFLLVLRDFVKKRGESARVDDAIAMFGKEYLDRFYTRERLVSDDARNAWIEPDRAAIEAAL